MRGRHHAQAQIALKRLWPLVAVLLWSGCSNEVAAPACKGESCQAGCTYDDECGDNQVCVDGACSTGNLPIGGPNSGPNNGPGAVGDGVVQLTPTGEVDFGSPAFGVAIERPISILNAGAGPLTVSGITRATGTSTEFTWTSEPPLPVALEVGDRVEITLLYTLADGEADVGSVVIATNANACQPACVDSTALTLDLISEFKGERNLALQPPTHDFGYVPVSGQSAARSLLISNDGTLGKLLTVTSLSATGDTGEFSFTLPQTPLYIAPGEVVDVPVVYQPTVSANGHQIVFDAEANSDDPTRTSAQATFTATSQPLEALVFDPPELVFANLAVGNTAQQSSTLRNIGGFAITVSALDVGVQTAVEYTVAPAIALPYTIVPGGTLDVYVDFTAAQQNASATTVSAQNNQPSGNIPILNVRGAGFKPPGGPNLDVTVGPETIMNTDCGCQAVVGRSTANVDVTYRSVNGGQVCGKPADPTCGVNGTCACDNMNNYGDVAWGSAGNENVRSDIWIIDEKITHSGGGADGSFVVRADLSDDCLAVPGSTSWTINFNCCEIDCNTEWNPQAPQACYDYGQFPSCASVCESESNIATIEDCLLRGPVATRTSVHIYGGGFDETRDFCTTLNYSGDGDDVVTIARQAGYFTIGSVAPGIVEVAQGAPCPAP